jgi:hypothetical protein
LPPNRVIAGGRTGGAFLNGDIDNIRVTIIPEPTSVMLFGIAAAKLMSVARRKKLMPRS